MPKGLKEFWNTPTPILVIKLALSIIIVTLATLSIFLNGVLLGYGMVGLGLLALTYGIENKIKRRGNLTLVVGIFAAVVFFGIAGYIFTNPFA